MSKGARARCVVLIRHGQTDWNQRYCFQGRTDIPLNDEGVLQAKRLSERLASWAVDVVYSSPLRRALNTAQIVAEPHGLSPVVLEDLMELHFGTWEGRSISGMEGEEEGSFRTWMRDPFFNMPPGAEDWESIRSRVTKAIEIILNGPEERIAVVSHGGIVRALFAVLLGLDPHSVWRFRVFNCSMSGVEIGSDGSALLFANDDLHLRGDTGGCPLPLW